MKQIVLDLGLYTGPTLSGFVTDDACPILQHLIHWVGSATLPAMPTYIWGAASSGKTHLSKALVHSLEERGASVGWMDVNLQSPPEFDEQWAAVVLDDVHLYTEHQQRMAFNWFINAMAPQTGQPRWVVATGGCPPMKLEMREDLRTRLGWGDVFSLPVLSELECKKVLKNAAKLRGLSLSNDVLQFMLARFSTDLGSLMTLLNALDLYAMQYKKAITIALLQLMLQEH